MRPTFWSGGRVSGPCPGQGSPLDPREHFSLAHPCRRREGGPTDIKLLILCAHKRKTVSLEITLWELVIVLKAVSSICCAVGMRIVEVENEIIRAVRFASDC